LGVDKVSFFGYITGVTSNSSAKAFNLTVTRIFPGSRVVDPHLFAELFCGDASSGAGFFPVYPSGPLQYRRQHLSGPLQNIAHGWNGARGGLDARLPCPSGQRRLPEVMAPAPYTVPSERLGIGLVWRKPCPIRLRWGYGSINGRTQQRGVGTLWVGK